MNAKVIKKGLILFCVLLCAVAARAYTPGNGTGLSGVVMGPVNTASYGMGPYDQFTWREELPVGNINIDTVSKTVSMFPSGTNFTRWVASWRGKLIVPEDATYRLQFKRQEKSDALRVCLDGNTLWSSLDLKVSSAEDSLIITNEVALKAGEYPIEIDWRPNRPFTYAWHTLVMMWDNDRSITATEVIPSSQLRSVEASALPDYRPSAIDGYTFNFAGSSTGYEFPYLKRLGVNDYEFGGLKPVNITAWAPVLGKELTGPFCLETTVDVEEDYDGYISLRFPGNVNSEGAQRNTFMFIYHWKNQEYGEAVCSLYLSQGEANANVCRWVANRTGVNSPARLRVSRDADGEIVFSIRGDGQSWQEIAVWQSGAAGEAGYVVRPESNQRITSTKGVVAEGNSSWAGASNPSFETSDRVFAGFGSMQSCSPDSAIGSSSRIREPFIGKFTAPTNAALNIVGADGKKALFDFDGATGPLQVQYRVQGTSDWTNYGALLPAGTTNIVIDGLSSPAVYEFRVVTAESLEMESASSSPIAIFSCGYGLSATVENLDVFSFGLSTLNSCRYREMMFFDTPYLDFVPRNGQTIFKEADYPYVLVSFRGKLVVPVSGTYTLRTTVMKNVGLKMIIGGTVLHDEWGTSPANSQAVYPGTYSDTIELTAGNHDLIIDLTGNNEYRTSFNLEWSRSANPESGDEGFEMVQIPRKNFLPASESELPVRCWNGIAWQHPPTAARGSGNKMSAVEKIGENDFRISASLDKNEISFYEPALLKPMTGAFTVEATFYSNEVDCAALICRSSTTSDWVVVEYNNLLAESAYSFTGSRLNDINRDNYGNRVWKTTPFAGTDAATFRIKRLSNSTDLKYYVSTRNATTGEWSGFSLYAESPGGSNVYHGATLAVLTNDVLYVGVTACRTAAQTIRDFKVYRVEALMIMLR